MDDTRLRPDLYVGSYPETPADIDRLRNEGITTVLNLQTRDDLEHLHVDWQRLLAAYRRVGVEVRRVPVRDFDEDDLRARLPDCVRTLDSLLQDGHLIYVHCTAGTGRSPAVVIAWLHWIAGHELDEAEQYVKARRPCSPAMSAIRLASRDRGFRPRGG